MTKLVRLTAQYYSPGGLINAGETAGLPDAIAAQMVTAGTAVLIDDGAGSGVSVSSPFAARSLPRRTRSSLQPGEFGQREPVCGNAGVRRRDDNRPRQGNPNSEAGWA